MHVQRFRVSTVFSLFCAISLAVLPWAFLATPPELRARDWPVALGAALFWTAAGIIVAGFSRKYE